MTRVARFPGAACLTVLLGTPLDSSADPIVIAAGSLEIGRTGGQLTLTGGTRGFTFVGDVSALSGVFMPFVLCPPCPPNDIDLSATWQGLGFSGGATATLDGRTFERVGGAQSRASDLIVNFGGSAPAPPVEGTRAVVMAPFTFSGSFRYDPDPDAPEQTRFATVMLTGSGTAIINLGRTEGIPTWTYSSASYRFQGSDPVPEPGTMLLVATGAALGASRLKRSLLNRRL